MGQVSILEDIGKRAEQALSVDEELREIRPIPVDRRVRSSFTRTCKMRTKVAPVRAEVRKTSGKPAGRALDMSDPMDRQRKITNLLRGMHSQMNAFAKAKRPIVVK